MNKLYGFAYEGEYKPFTLRWWLELLNHYQREAINMDEESDISYDKGNIEDSEKEWNRCLYCIEIMDWIKQRMVDKYE